jgi:hypothetical protein
MDIWEINSFILFIAFFIPGFVAQKTYSLFYTSETPSANQTVINAVAYSCINYGLFSPILYFELASYLYSPTTYEFALRPLFVFFLLFICPILVSLFYVFVPNVSREIPCLRGLMKYIRYPVPKPWDYVFRDQSQFYKVIMEFSDGKRIGGLYQDKSFTSSFPEDEQIYLEEVWEIKDHKFIRKIPDSKGILASSKDLKFLELYEMHEEELT